MSSCGILIDLFMLLPAAAEAVGSVVLAFTVAVCAALTSEAAPFVPGASADTALPDADTGLPDAAMGIGR